MNPKDLTHAIIGAAIEVHRELGPGKAEAAYERALCHELSLRGLPYQAQRPLPLVYKGMKLDCGYRIDVLAADTVVLEVKAVEAIAPIHDAQVLTYQRIGGWRWALLLNFHVPLLKEGIKRFVLDPIDTTEARRTQREGDESFPPGETQIAGDSESNQVSRAVIGAALEVHSHLGPGLLRSAYHACLGEMAEVELLVANRVAVRPRAVGELQTLHEIDLLSLLKLGGWSQGLLLNFNTPSLRNGIRRLLDDQ